MIAAAGASSILRLEGAVEQWVAKKARRTLSELRQELSLPRALALRSAALEMDLAAHEATTQALLGQLLEQPEGARVAWIDQRSWGEDGVSLGEALLDQAERQPLVERIDLARLAARLSALAAIPLGDALLQARLEDNLGRAGLLEVRSLRRRGELTAARRRFAEIDTLLEMDDAPLRFWLTLEADRCLTAGLLARDEGRLEASAVTLRRTERLLRVAGSEEDDAELLAAQVRTDLAGGAATRAVDRFIRRAELETPARRLELAFLLVLAALRTDSPMLARHALVGLGSELGAHPTIDQLDRYLLLDAATTLAESQPLAALEQLAAPAARLRAAGSLEGSLRAAIVAARAELARRQPAAAQAALAAGVLEHFHDLPATPAIRNALQRITDRAAAGVPNLEFLSRLDLWLILVVDSPGIEFS